MPFHVFLETLNGWPTQLCALEAAAGCPPETYVDPGELHIMSSFLEPYVLNKLAPFADIPRLQPAGGSPGT